MARKTRFAPSPTGHLHAGHLLHLLVLHGLAAKHKMKVLIRIEDHDKGRYRPEYEHSMLADLCWLGLIETPEWPKETGFQRDRTARYDQVLQTLFTQNLAYYCDCSRKDIEKRIGKTPPGSEQPYDGHCRSRGLSSGSDKGIRLIVDTNEFEFVDHIMGSQKQNLAEQCGDFLIRDRNDCYTYQFCVVIDDIDDQITDIIRGEDLLTSTGRQIYLRKTLYRLDESLSESTLKFWHHPLVMGDEFKLSKRHKDSGLAELRNKFPDGRQYFASEMAKLERKYPWLSNCCN